MKKSEHIESRLNSRNIRIIYLCFDHNLLRFSGFCSEFWPKKDLPRSLFSVTKDSASTLGGFLHENDFEHHPTTPPHHHHRNSTPDLRR